MQAKSFSLNISHKIRPFHKSIIVDSDKSLSIRSFLIGSISEDISVAKNVLESDDVFSTINCLRKLGIKIKKKSNSYFIYGKGLGSLLAKKKLKLNFGNSGTLARLLIGILSTTPDIDIRIQGDQSRALQTPAVLLLAKVRVNFCIARVDRCRRWVSRACH